ncbi:conserved exported protein of unknown function [Burkholderia multivorans]
MNRFHQKIASLLGLLAILMATFAPTISHTLAARAASDDFAPALCSLHGDPDGGAQDDANPHSLAAHWHACGYCSLLAHAPVLPVSAVVLAVAAAAVEQQVAVRFETLRRVFVHTAAQPRAPPVRFLI